MSHLPLSDYAITRETCGHLCATHAGTECRGYEYRNHDQCVLLGTPGPDGVLAAGSSFAPGSSCVDKRCYKMFSGDAAMSDLGFEGPATGECVTLTQSYSEVGINGGGMMQMQSSAPYQYERRIADARGTTESAIECAALCQTRSWCIGVTVSDGPPASPGSGEGAGAVFCQLEVSDVFSIADAALPLGFYKNFEGSDLGICDGGRDGCRIGFPEEQMAPSAGQAPPAAPVTVGADGDGLECWRKKHLPTTTAPPDGPDGFIGLSRDSHFQRVPGSGQCTSTKVPPHYGIADVRGHAETISECARICSTRTWCIAISGQLVGTECHLERPGGVLENVATDAGPCMVSNSPPYQPIANVRGVAEDQLDCSLLCTSRRWCIGFSTDHVVAETSALDGATMIALGVTCFLEPSTIDAVLDAEIPNGFTRYTGSALSPCTKNCVIRGAGLPMDQEYTMEIEGLFGGRGIPQTCYKVAGRAAQVDTSNGGYGSHPDGAYYGDAGVVEGSGSLTPDQMDAMAEQISRGHLRALGFAPLGDGFCTRTRPGSRLTLHISFMARDSTEFTDIECLQICQRMPWCLGATLDFRGQLQTFELTLSAVCPEARQILVCRAGEAEALQGVDLSLTQPMWRSRQCSTTKHLGLFLTAGRRRLRHKE
eukprot:g2160.t1